MATDPQMFRPASTEDSERWEHQRRRRTIQEGDWRGLLDDHLTEHLSATRQHNLGRPVTAICLQRSLASQLAVLHDREPTIRVEAPDEEAAVDLLRESGCWSIAHHNDEAVIAYRENLVRVGWSASQKRPSLRLVSPDLVVVRTAPGDVYDIREIREWRLRTRSVGGKDVEAGYWDVWSVEEGGSFRILDERDEDWTLRFLPEDDVARGYQYRWPDGTPYLPWVLYHAEDTGRLWDWRTWMEVYEGTLDAGLLWSLFFHCARDASWLQKYVVDLRLEGTTVVDVTGDGHHVSHEIETSPSSILVFRSIGDKGGSAGTFAAPIKPQEFAAAVVDYMQTVVSHIGIHPADLERDANAQSGYAIQLKRSAQRRLGLRYEPQFRRGDLELIRKVAQASNIFAGTRHPLAGYSITYHPIEDTVDEESAQFGLWQKQVEANQMSRVELHRRLHPGMSEDEAMVRLVEIELLNRGITMGADRDLDEAKQQTEAAVAAARGEETPMVEEPSEAVDGVPVPAAGSVQDTALNGAQVEAAKSIVESVAAGALPRDSGIEMLVAFFRIDPAVAEKVMGSVGTASWRPTPKETPAPKAAASTTGGKGA